MQDNKEQIIYYPLPDGKKGEAWVRACPPSGGDHQLGQIRVLPTSNISNQGKRNLQNYILQSEMESLTPYAPLTQIDVRATDDNENTSTVCSDPLEHYVFPTILAMRIANGVIQLQCEGDVYAIGYSDDWIMGRVQSYPAQQMKEDLAWLKENTNEGDIIFLPSNKGENYSLNHDEFKAKVIMLSSIGELSGEPIQEKNIRKMTVTFPAVSNQSAYSELNDLSITITPSLKNKNEVLLHCVDQADNRRDKIAGILQTIRNEEQNTYKTQIEISGNSFDGESYQLALVTADLIVRGKQFKPMGKLYATGQGQGEKNQPDWRHGKVMPVGSIPQKLELINRVIRSDDRVLLPKTLPNGELIEENIEIKALLTEIRNKGASVVCIDNIKV